MTKRLIAMIPLLMIVATLKAQEAPKIKKSEFLVVDSKETWKNIKLGNKYYKKSQIGGYRLAAKYYSEALEANDSYAPLLYRLGVSEVMTGADRLALRHLDDALALSPFVTKDCQYWLGISKQHLNMFSEAKNDFDEFVLNFDKKTKKLYSNNVNLHIAQCGLGETYKKMRDMAVLQPVSGTINSSMPEFAPVFCNRDSSLYFASRRSEGNVSKKRGKDYDPRADIFASKASQGIFSDVTNHGKPLSTKKDEYPVYINLTGGKMLYCRKEKKIYFSCKKSENSNWLKPSKFLKKATSAAFSSDSSLVVFAAYKGKEHRGGSDLYIMKRNGKKYSKPQNLGEFVNTPYDEMSPSFGPKDTVIYFASNGQYSVGGFDILKTRIHNGKWNAPVNLGLGLNCGADDNYFQLSPGETRIGYCASKRNGGVGDYDLYKVLLLNEPQIMMPPLPYRELAVDMAKEPPLTLETPETIKTMRLTVVRGTVTDYDGEKFLQATVAITDNATSQTLQTITTDPQTGNFMVMLPSGKNYAMTVSTDGYMFHSENFNIPSTTNYQEIHKDIKLLPMDPGSKVVLNNVFFDTGSSNLRSESYGELNRLAEIFKLYPALVIEVSGHTDNQGNRNYNITLSQQRAEAVRDYIISTGVVESQVVAKGYGPDQPRDTNATAEGRQNNRRVEAKILRN